MARLKQLCDGDFVMIYDVNVSVDLSQSMRMIAKTLGF